MSGSTSKWREEQILVICPGSQTTMAQLGCGELTPPAYRIPTRMFKDEESDDWQPYRTEKRRKVSASGAGPPDTNGVAKGSDKDEWEYVEDPDSTEGAVYPIRAGRITNMDALLAFLDHVHSMLTTTYHNTPIMLMASPQWTRQDFEAIARYIFEKTKTPALCLIHSGVATQYGLKWPHMTVVDVGYEKVDVTCIYDSRVVSHKEAGPSWEATQAESEISGGEVFTQKLLALLKDKGFDREMAEQLKRSPICEVLPYAADFDALMELPTENATGTAGPASQTTAAPAPLAVPEGQTRTAAEPARLPEVDVEDGVNGEGKSSEEDGVLDVANIVASGNTREFLAKKEKEKAEKSKGGGRWGKNKEAAEAAAAKPTRLPNAKRGRNIFHYEEIVEEDVIGAAAPAPSVVVPPETLPAATEPPATTITSPSAAGTSQENGSKDVEMTDASAPPLPVAGENSTTVGEDVSKPERNGDVSQTANGERISKPEDDGVVGHAPAALADVEVIPATESAPAASESAVPERQNKRVRRDIEVGLERFLFADRAEIDRIVTAIYRAVQGIEDMYMRPACWENLVFVGNGARVRGLKENILQTLTARHLVSPSTATIFTSELPSNLATPSGTGSQTPTGSYVGQLPTTSSVNPLLQAATTASLGIPGPTAASLAPGSNAGGDVATSHHFHSQTPTAIKLTTLPTYLSEWTKNGFEESMFLGAQVAARLAFCIHNLDAAGLESQRLMSFNRVDYK